MTNRFLILSLIVSTFFSSKAQIDTSFWFVAPDISNNISTPGDAPIVLHIQTYSQASNVYIRQPALTGTAAVNTSVSIAAASIFSLDLTTFLGSVESAPVNTVSNKGLYISAKENVSVFYTIGNQNNGNCEMICLKGRRALGTDFYACVPSSSLLTTFTVSDGGVGFDIVATEPGLTTVLITPKANCVGHSKNVTFLRTLTLGQTFSVLDTNKSTVSEIAGSIISSDKPISVTVKGTLRSVAYPCGSTFADQITPTDVTGKDYVIVKGNGTTDAAFVLAHMNASSFTLSSISTTFVTLINATETFSFNLTDPVYFVHSDRPVYLFHVSGYGCRFGGTQLAPAYCAGSYTTAFVRNTSDSLTLNIWIRNGYQNSFTLTSNNSALNIAPNVFTVVPGTNGNLVAARVFVPTASIAVGSYNELRNGADIFGVSVRNGGTSNGTGYTQASEFSIDAFAHANFAPTATTCANNQFTLNGAVGGGPNTGIWSLVNGFGTFIGGITQLTNNIYVPSLLDTTNNDLSIPPNNRFVKIVLNTTGVCPNVSDTLKLHVRQPPIVSAGANSVICGNNPTLQLSGNVYGATNQGYWNVLIPASGNFMAGANTFTPIYQLAVTDTMINHLEFVLTSTNNAGCNPVSDTVVVMLAKPAFVVASTVNPIVKCSNNSTINLNGSVSGTTTSTGIWQTSGNGIFTPNSTALNGNYVPGSSDLSNSNVWLYLESTNNGICLPVKDSVQILFTQPPIVSAGSDINSCVNDPRVVLSGQVTGSVTSSGFWLGGIGTYTPSNAALNGTYIATPAEVAFGFITLTLTTTNNGLCLGIEDVVRINFQQEPLSDFSVSPVCLGQLSEFNDKSVNPSQLGSLNQWVWDFGDNSVPSTSLNPRHLYSSVGTYTVQLIVRNNFNCFDTMQKTVQVSALPSASFQLARDCNGSSQLIKFFDRSSITAPDIIPASGHYWDFGGYGFSFAKDTSLVFPSEGIYNITHIVTSDKGCQSVISRSIDITPKPVARFIYLNNSVQGLGATVNFRDTSSFAESWSWNFGNGDSSYVRHPSTFYKDNGLYPVKLRVADQFGCLSTYSLEVRINNIVTEIVKLVPNVITPNDDGKNDEWRLDFIDVYFPKAQITIFNRWGQQIFTSTGYSNAWDGSYKGDPLPVGVYYYTIDLRDNINPVIKGSVTLLK
jgi:gliding motility-associated-like protein